MVHATPHLLPHGPQLDNIVQPDMAVVGSAATLMAFAAVRSFLRLPDGVPDVEVSRAVVRLGCGGGRRGCDSCSGAACATGGGCRTCVAKLAVPTLAALRQRVMECSATGIPPLSGYLRCDVEVGDTIPAGVKLIIDEARHVAASLASDVFVLAAPICLLRQPQRSVRGRAVARVLLGVLDVGSCATCLFALIRRILAFGLAVAETINGETQAVHATKLRDISLAGSQRSERHAIVWR